MFCLAIILNTLSSYLIASMFDSFLIMFIALFFIYRRKKSDILLLETVKNEPVLKKIENADADFAKQCDEKFRILIKKIKNNIFNHTLN